ncbi:MAG: DNA polymerase III subunit delta [bacterium]|nr:DNA polymerase III subunit delta [bacterium]
MERKIDPVYIFLGEEAFYKQELISFLKQKIILSSFSLDFNYRHFYAGDTSLPEFLDYCNTPPSFSEKRLVIAENIELWKSKDLKVLDEYLKSPADFTCLVLNSQERRVGKYGKGYPAVSLFYPLREPELKSWIVNKVRENNKSITAEAADVLMRFCNNSLIEMNDEISKLVLYVRERGEISRKDVEAITADSRQYNVFDLLDSINQHNLAGALKIFSRLYDSYEESRKRPGAAAGERAGGKEKEESGDTPRKSPRESVKGKDNKLYGFFAFLSTTLHQIYQIKYLHEVGKKDPGEIQRELNMKETWFRNLFSQIRNYDLKKFSRIINILFQFDAQFKGAGAVFLRKEKLFQDLIYSLCKT